MFVCYRFSLIQGSQIAIRLKGKANSVQKPKSLLGKRLETQNVGDTQISSDMGTLLLCVRLLSFL